MFFQSVYLNVVFTLTAVLLAAFYYYVKHLYSYWTRRGVAQLSPTFPFGNFGKMFLKRMSILDLLNDTYYRASTHPFIGTYSFMQPSLMVRDPEIIRNILISDFAYFTNRGVYVDEENDPISAHLFSLEGDQWKNLRIKLSPTFSSGKLKAMFSTLSNCRNSLLRFIEQRAAATNESIDAREMCACFTTNAIASVAFGIDTDCFIDPNNPFRKYGRKIFEPTLKNGFRMLCFISGSKTLLRWTGLKFCDRDVEQFFIDMVRQTLKLREEQNIVRKDFFQLLVMLRNTGTVQLDDEWRTVIANDNEKTLTIEQMTAQSLIFFVAGFETSSSVMSFCLYEIAKNPDIQRQVHAEIDAVLTKYNGQFTYESINEMTYLECCIDETMRKYPVVPALGRKCTKEYTLPGTKITLEEGTRVTIPVLSLHGDAKYFPNPEIFDPERFSNANKYGKTFADMPYLPFGDGPRNCIGMRMGKLFTKVGVTTILHRFRIQLDSRHIGKDLKFAPDAIIAVPIGGIHLKIQHKELS